MANSLFATTFTHTTTTRLPAGTRKADVLRLLHDHAAMISLNPLVIRHEPLPSSSPSASAPTSTTTTPSPPTSSPPNAPIAYRITDKLSYLPFGLWTGEVSYTATFTDAADGLQTLVRAPMGLVSEGVWKVEVEKEDGKGGGGEDEGGLVLHETARVLCSRFVKAFVEGTMRRSHEELVARFVEEVGRRGGGSGSGGL